ncbi:unnamed protein product [Sphagnum jensenii]|uniref:FAD-binding domain-containing protein n=1 Tax=Sphagnum jensenii TaxID=128206 RepID=A0ABP1B2U9_9BRYO
MGVEGIIADGPEVLPKLPPVHNVLIVGAGLTGLATALALHRLGVDAVVVLEQSKSLRNEGAALTLFPNAWRVLDALGVADVLRPHFINIMGPHEMRQVERKQLLAALYNPIPKGVVRFNSRVTAVRKPAGAAGPQAAAGVTQVELEDGTIYSTKVLLGCDGGGSVIAKWAGLTKPQPVGQIVIRGLCKCEQGVLHNLEPVYQHVIGKGVRLGLTPVTHDKVYWFLVFNASSSPAAQAARSGTTQYITDPLQIREEALQHTKGWPQDVVKWIEKTPIEGLNRGIIRDRCTWSVTPTRHSVLMSIMTPAAAALRFFWNKPAAATVPLSNAITLVGDAWHPMTPNLAQGGCIALEDSITVARKLHQALNNINKPDKKSNNNNVKQLHKTITTLSHSTTTLTTTTTTNSSCMKSNYKLNSEEEELLWAEQMPRVIAALAEYQRERRFRTFVVTVKSHLFGSFLGWDSSLVCFLRDKVILPLTFRASAVFGVTTYDCGQLVRFDNTQSSA